MNIDETIDSFRLGRVDLDCKQIVLSQNKEGGERFEGQGYIKQGKDGVLIFKLYVTHFENAKPLGHLEARTSAYGTLHGDDAFYNLSAVALDGTKLTSTRILPSIHWAMSDGSADIAHGQLQSLVADIELPQPNHYLALYFFKEYDLPLHVMSEAEKTGGKFLTLDSAEFDAGCSKFFVKMRKGSGETVIEATSETAFPTAFHLRVQEALQYITGRTAAYRARVEGNYGSLFIELYSPRQTSSYPLFVPPISPAKFDFREHGWDLFVAYLSYVVASTGDTYWNPAAYHLYNACESSANSIDAWAIGVSVAVEAVASLVTLEADTKGDDRITRLQQLMREYLETKSEFGDVAERMKGLIGMLGKKRPQDTLHALAKDGFVEKAYIDSWTKLRNRHVHPTIKDLKKPDQVDNQKLIDRIHRVQVLLYQLTFHLIGYKGPYTDYGVRGFPTKSYPLSVP